MATIYDSVVQTNTLNGTSGDDTIYGGSTVLTPEALTGNDTINAAAGNDTVIAGDGNDSVLAGTGNDTVFGGTGTDTAFGGAGTDTLEGGADADRLDGGGSADTIRGDAGNDSIDGAAGNDAIDGGDGADTVEGGGGTDSIAGGLGNDLLYGDDPTPATAGARETLSWTAAGPTGTDISGGFRQDTGGMNVAVNYTDDGGGTGLATSNVPIYRATGETISTTSSGILTGTGAGNTSTTSITFDPEPGSGLSDQVTNVAFRINDIDSGGGGFRDQVTVRAFDANGNPVTVTLTPAGDDTVSGGTVTGGAGSDTPSTAGGSVLVTIPGPVTRIEIDYNNVGTGGNQSIHVSDVQFSTAPATEGADTITGGDGDDTILGQGGNDLLQGDVGNDSISGGTGDDNVQGGTGNDSLVGDAGNDTLTGGAGNDAQFGGDGADAFVVTEADGIDAIQGGEGGTDQDVLRLTSTVSGVSVTYTSTEAGSYAFGAGGASGTFAQIESVAVSALNDSINAAALATSVTLSGLAGADTLTGGSAADTLLGGDGNDTLAGGLGADRLDGGTGLDTADYSASNAAVTVNLTTGAASGGHAQGDTFAGVDGIIGSGFDDTLIGANGEDLLGPDVFWTEIRGGAGNDFIDGVGGTDTLFGGTGNDTVQGGAGNDSVSGDEGDDTVSGGAGNDSVSGGAGSDTILVAPGEGVDALAGGENVGDLDTLAFDPGATTTGTTVTFTGNEAGTYAFGSGSGSFVEVERITTGAGADTVNAAATTAGVAIASGAGNDTLTGGAGADSLDGGDGADSLTGGAGNDTLLGALGADRLAGGVGNDSVSGGADADVFVVGASEGADALDGGATGTDADTLAFDNGATGLGVSVTFTTNEAGTYALGTGSGTFADIETVTGTAGNDLFDASAAAGGVSLAAGAGLDSLIGGSGADSLDGEAGADTLDGGVGNDTLFGGNGADTLLGGLGADTLFGGEGTDVLAGGDGNDNLSGGDGNDTLRVGANEGADAIDGGATGTDQDVLAFDAGATTLGVDVTFTGNEAGTFGFGTGTGSFTDVERLQGTGNADSFNAAAATTAVSIAAGAGTDTVIGGQGSDTLDGGDGNDSLSGGAGADTLLGGLGDDRLAGGAGADSLNGGAGQDTFVLGDDAGADAIQGGSAAVDLDTLDLSTQTTGATVTFTGAEDGAAGVATFLDIERVILTAQADTADARLSSLAVSLDGGAGNDTLLGGSGDDSLAGGAGDDRIGLSDGFGADTIAGGEGGEATGDVLDATAVTTGVTVTFTGAEAGTISSGGSNASFSEVERLSLGDGADSVTGTVGEQDISLGAGADQVRGGAGNDRIDLGADDDADVVVLADGDGTDTIANFQAPILNPDGTFTPRDRIDVTGLTQPNGEPVTVRQVTVTSDPSGNAVLTFPGGESLVLLGVSAATLTPGALNALGVPFPDGTIDGTAGDDVIDAGYTGDPDGDRVDAGDALLPGAGPEDDVIDAAAGNDSVLAGLGNDQVDGGLGDDTVFGAEGNDSLVGADGNDSLDGGLGDDALFGGEGNDSLAGGDGGDVLTGGAGADSLSGGLGNDELSGDAGGDTLAGDAGDDTLFGGDNADALFGGDGLDTASGGAGNDDIDGGADADVLAGGLGDDRIEGGLGLDSLQGEAGNDSLFGGEGDDALFGGEGSDSLSGGLGADALAGDAGNDRIGFGRGDTVLGGEGDDTFTFADLGEPAGGTVSVVGGEGGEAGGGDTLNLGTAADLSTLVITNPDDAAGGLSGQVTLDDGTILLFDQIEQIICFAEGTRIATARGAVAVEDLRLGDLVLTRDHGLQEVRWTGARRVPALGKLAPVRIRPGVVPGLQRDLVVSPQHKILFQGYRAELLFGEAEVLVPALHLVDGVSVTRDEGGWVTYHHVLFDRHEIIYSEGAATESFHPGEMGLSAVDEAAREELFGLFPELRDHPASYGQAARRCLKRHEARLLRS